MNITHKVNIDLAFAHHGAALPIRVMQGDGYSRSIAFTLTSNGEAWIAPEGTTVCVGYHKPDSTGGIYDTLPDGTVAWTIAENVLTVAIAPQAMTVSGEVKLAVTMFSGDAVISTFPVTIHVQQLPGFGESSEDYVKLMNLLPAVTQADNGKFLQVVNGAWAAVAVELTAEIYDGTVEVS